MAITIDGSSYELPALPNNDQIGKLLQPILLKLIDLALLGKQLHWSVVGENFLGVHKILDDFIDEWRGMYDTVAERMVQIKVMPDGQASAVAKVSTSVPVGQIDDDEVISKLVVNLAAAVKQVRTAMVTCGKLDLVSQNILIGIAESLEKQLWFTRAQAE